RVLHTDEMSRAAASTPICRPVQAILDAAFARSVPRALMKSRPRVGSPQTSIARDAFSNPKSPAGYRVHQRKLSSDRRLKLWRYQRKDWNCKLGLQFIVNIESIGDHCPRHARERRQID